uniref:Uncharacterized protein n=1 Tax=Aegilops tauschii subsp. strangulata TaxID=200361 RepID=A0A453MRE9_AEGTS
MRDEESIFTSCLAINVVMVIKGCCSTRKDKRRRGGRTSLDMHIAPPPLPFFFRSFCSLLIHPLLLLFSAAHGQGKHQIDAPQNTNRSKSQVLYKVKK